MRSYQGSDHTWINTQPLPLMPSQKWKKDKLWFHQMLDQSISSKKIFRGNVTRDIELSDSILDLLDNCLDGVLRKIISPLSKHLESQTYIRGIMPILSSTKTASK